MHALGPYLLVRRIGRGGMAEIFLARREGPEGFAKTVALKCILPHLADQPDLVTMFLDEARLAARLSHPHIVQIHDFGCVDNTYFIAMEYVAGEDLTTVLGQARENGQLPPPTVSAAILAAACDALHYAHELPDEHGSPLRLIHRDVSPSNLLLSYDGVVKLADFGIARAERRVSQTHAGGIKGKYAYVAPEVVAGRDFDARSDLFSLGVVGYELIAGKRPFESSRDPAVLRAAHEQPIVPPSQLARVPAELEAIVLRALARDPDERYPTAHAMQIDLERYLVSTGTTGTRLQLADYMRGLFGADRADGRRAAGAELPPGAATETMPEQPADHTVLDASMASVPFTNDTVLGAPTVVEQRRPRWRWLVIAVSLVASGGAAAVWLRPNASPAAPSLDAAVATPVADAEVPADAAPIDAGVAVVHRAPVHQPDATFSLQVTPAATVLVDGARLGQSPIKHALRPGKHRVVVVSSDGCRVSYDIDVAPGQVLEHERVLRRGQVTVKVDPWADIYVAGKRIDQTPAVITLSEGVCPVTLVHPDSGQSKTVQVKVDPAKPTVVRTSFSAR